MPDNFAIFVDGISNLNLFKDLDKEVERNLVRAVNKATRDGRAKSARFIREQVNFPARYLSPGGKRLVVGKPATLAKAESKIIARTRATSLARFVSGTPRRGDPVRVEVSPGKARYLRNAFLVKLPAGSQPVDTKFNLGLAIRLGPNETLRNKVSARKLTKGLYLLYGPSVDQVFLDNSGDGVARDVEPSIMDNLEDEFLRLMDL